MRIICISGMVETDKVDELLAVGADEFLQKPFDVEVLLQRMCRFLGIEAVPSLS